MKMGQCPHCQGALQVVAKKCEQCSLELRADFDENPLTRLPREDQDFLLEFVLASGNFKALSDRLDLTYPTLRSRLDKILGRLSAIMKTPAPEEVLDAVDTGALSPEEAIRALKKLAAKESAR